MTMTLPNIICHEPHTLLLDDFCQNIQVIMAVLGKIELEVIFISITRTDISC